jgi:hypothetical protein
MHAKARVLLSLVWGRLEVISFCNLLNGRYPDLFQKVCYNLSSQILRFRDRMVLCIDHRLIIPHVQ